MNKNFYQTYVLNLMLPHSLFFHLEADWFMKFFFQFPKLSAIYTLHVHIICGAVIMLDITLRINCTASYYEVIAAI